MTTRAQIITWAAFCVFCIVLVWTAMFGGSAEPVLQWMDRNEKAAAWVQAFGSIAAILASGAVAVWVFYREAEHRRDERLTAHLETQLGAARVLQTAIMTMTSAFGTCLKNTEAGNWTIFKARLIEEGFRVARDLLMSINGTDLPPRLELQRGVLFASIAGGLAYMARVSDELPDQPLRSATALRSSIDSLREVQAMVDEFLY
ncbi:MULTISPECIES: hypothetical protein [unclassified Brevundimonas]|uniref:hypothetical protein n=1 Tax=unclassified Brevundimonas TaxID=2622653 RepID=UPI0025C2D040|nr:MULTISPECIES: hypothetical protein [unclassified Brevundimonas]